MLWICLDILGSICSFYWSISFGLIQICFGNRFFGTRNTMETRRKRPKENDEMDGKISKAVCGMSDDDDDVDDVL
ncbi:unnamed protein product [Schistosoma curassoni]|uniref:Transmembrane protein n=1 Tax=Schistosoma curassoni TaxID=6186 RepID=A0A183KA32_9TREM|nr:unnamed protein product [Schistosoma curassoni]